MRTSIPRTALMALGSALFVAAGGAMCAAALAGLLTETGGVSSFALLVGVINASLYLVIGLVAILFFSFGLLYFAGRLLFFQRPILEVGPRGILDRASALGVGFVPWEEVKEVRSGWIHGHRYVVIEVKGEKELLGRQNPAKRLLMRLNRRYFTGAPINIPLNALAISEEDLTAEILHYLGFRRGVAEKLRWISKPNGTTDDGGSASQVAGSVVRWTVVVALSVVYHGIFLMILVGFGIPGVMFAWNGLSPWGEPTLDRPVAGVVLLALAVVLTKALVTYFPRLVKKVTGRNVVGPLGD